MSLESFQFLNEQEIKESKDNFVSDIPNKSFECTKDLIDP